MHAITRQRHAESDRRKRNLWWLINSKHQGSVHLFYENLEPSLSPYFMEGELRRQLEGPNLIWPTQARRIERAAGLKEGWLDEQLSNELLNKDEGTIISTFRSLKDGTATEEALVQLLILIGDFAEPRQASPNELTGGAR